MTEHTVPPVPKGRPRSVAAEAAVIAAATAMMEEMLPAAITADAIAKRAGVSKATLYKWWPTKTHVIMDAILQRMTVAIPLPDTGTAHGDFTETMLQFVRFHTQTAFGRAVIHLFAEGLADPSIMQVYNERYLWPRRLAMLTLWERGVARGEIRADIDPHLGLDLLYGPLTARYFSQLFPIDEAMARATVDTVFSGLMPRC